MVEVPKAQAEEFAEYVRRLSAARADPTLTDLERRGREAGIPILGPAAAGFAAGMLRTRGGNALELGTAMGYTAVWLGRVARENGGKVIAVDHSPAMVREARANMGRAGLDGVVEVVEADALRFLQESRETYDVIVLDIDKHEYAAAQPVVVDQLAHHGALVADNVSFPDAREFLSLLLSDDRLDTSVLYGFWPGHSPEWDAISLSVKRDSGTGTRVGVLG